jgi:hypothetical protein
MPNRRPSASLPSLPLCAPAGAFAAVAPVAGARANHRSRSGFIDTAPLADRRTCSRAGFAERPRPAPGRAIVAGDTGPAPEANVAMYPAASRSAPDGYTLVITRARVPSRSTRTFMPARGTTRRDFVPINQMTRALPPLAWIPCDRVAFGSRADALREQKTWWVNYGSPGTGTPRIWPVELFKTAART